MTHDQSEAMTMSDRIAVFDDGVIRQLSTPNILYEKPENAFVAQFIGENNRLSGKVTEIRGDKCAVEINDGGYLKALKVNVDGIGDRTSVSLRPERVKVNPADGSVDNIFEGKVEELIYLGDNVRTRVNVCCNEEFIVKIPNSQGHRLVEKGRNIKLGWLSDDCRALDPF